MGARGQSGGGSNRYKARSEAAKQIRADSKKVSTLKGVINRYKRNILKLNNPSLLDKELQTPEKFDKYNREKSSINQKIKQTEQRIDKLENNISKLQKKHKLGTPKQLSFNFF